LDTHTLFWSVEDPSKVSQTATAIMADPANDRLLSAATIWELSIKVGLRKLGLSMPYRQWMERAIIDLKLTTLPITVEYADLQTSLPMHHRDPFDRLLIAQALVDDIPIASADVTLDLYGVKRLW
jgi:PIN domain nuclease of toxin-antitoxin system